MRLFGYDMQDPHNFQSFAAISLNKYSDTLQLLLHGFTSVKPV